MIPLGIRCASTVSRLVDVIRCIADAVAVIPVARVIVRLVGVGIEVAAGLCRTIQIAWHRSDGGISQH